MPPDRWYWAKERRSKGFILRRSLPPEAAAHAIEEFGGQFRLAEQRKLRDFYNLPPVRRAALALSDPSLAAANDPRHFERNRSFFSFVENLTERDLRAIGAGERLEMPLSGLSPRQRQFIRDEFDSSDTPNPMGPGAADPLDKVYLYSRGNTLFLNLGPRGGYGVLGGIWLDQAEREQGLREWLGPGDTAQAPDEPVPAPGEKARPEELQIVRVTANQVLHRLGRLARVNVLADCTPAMRAATYSMDFGIEGRLPEVLPRLARLDLIWKRSAPFLLFRRVDWIQGRLLAVPTWPVLRGLRAVAAGNEGYLRPDDWLRLSALRQDQLEQLEDEFPDADRIKDYQSILRLVAGMTEREREALARPGGAGRADWSPATWSRLLVLFSLEDARRLRLSLQWMTDAQPPVVRIHLRAEGQVSTPNEIKFEPRKEEKKEAPPSASPAD
ncbi:MAG TPA: hypothetical protein VK689_16330 [Armatimonadota bacterium]|nr:hypothetical protein [Armatimonadota bacterium]